MDQVQGPSSPAEELELAGADYADWKRLNAEILEVESRIRLIFALAIMAFGGRITQLQEERRQAAERLRSRYPVLCQAYAKDGARTVKLPGDAHIRTQAAGGKPKINIIDKYLALRGIRRRRLATKFITWSWSFNLRRLQEEAALAATIPGIEVEKPEDGFFIDGRKVNPKTGATT